MKRTCWIYTGLLALAIGTTAHAAAFFVDADLRDDSSSGISAASPFQTIQRAIDKAAATPGPDMIHVASGVYEENLIVDDADGLILSGSGESVVVAADASEDVIAVVSGDVTISGLLVTGEGNGIDAAGSDEAPVFLTLKDVDVIGNAGNGLSATNVVTVTVVHGIFSENGDDGLQVEKAEAVSITGTAFLNNGSDGIDLEEIDIARATDLIVDGNGDEGLEVDDSGSVRVVRGIYSNSFDDGLDLDDTQAISVVGIVSTGNGGNGLQIEAEEDFDTESLSIVNSEFSDNAEDGIKTTELAATIQQVTVTATTVRDNVESGLDITASGHVRVTAVSSESNGQPDVLP